MKPSESQPQLTDVQVPSLRMEKTPSSDMNQHLLVDLEQLILGRPLYCPILDQSGVLLLAEGSIINEVFRQKLRERNITMVQAHTSDVHHKEFRVDTVHDQRVLAAETYQKTVNDRLAKVLQDKLTLVNNDGPAFLDSVVNHGAKSYNKTTRDKQLQQQHVSSRVLSSNMQNLIEGKAISGSELYRVISQSMQQMQEDVGCFTSLGQLLSRDRSLAMHCQRMSNLAMGIGLQLGLNAENIQRIGMTGLLHDWGMLMIPKEIRDPAQPPGHLEEMELAKHCRYSQDIIEKIPQLPMLVSLLSYQVHERIDGTGYPRRKSEKGIHLFARILHIAYEYCFLTTPTRYRPAFAPHVVMAYLLHDENKACRDPLVMRGLLRHHSLFPVGSFVQLSDQRLAKVIRTNGDKFNQPIVEISHDAHVDPVNAQQEIVDLLHSELKILQAIPTPGRVESIEVPGRLDQAHPSLTGSHLLSQRGSGYLRRVYLKTSGIQQYQVKKRKNNLLRGI